MKVAAGFVSVFLGLGFGIPCVFAIRHFAQTGEVWTFMGFPTYGKGPFERIGVQTSNAPAMPSKAKQLPLATRKRNVLLAPPTAAAAVQVGAPIVASGSSSGHLLLEPTACTKIST